MTDEEEVLEVVTELDRFFLRGGLVSDLRKLHGLVQLLLFHGAQGLNVRSKGR